MTFKSQKLASALAVSLALCLSAYAPEEVSAKEQQTEPSIEAIESQFSEFENDPAAGLRGLEQLRFLEKWAAQCQERLISVLS